MTLIDHGSVIAHIPDEPCWVVRGHVDDAARVADECMGETLPPRNLTRALGLVMM